MKRTNLILLAVATFAGLQPQAKARITLGSASSFAILAGTGITFSTAGVNITGDIGSYSTTTVAGLSNVTFVTSGANRSLDSSIMPTAKSDLVSAYNAISGATTTTSLTGVINLTGPTLTPGVYAITSTTTDITGDLTLNGGPTDVFIFKMSDTLITANSSSVLLTGGVLASNVFWRVVSSATLGDSSHFAGSVLADTAITMGIGATVDGRLLANTAAVTLSGSGAIAVPTAIPEPATTALIAAFGALGIAFWRRRRAAC